MINAIIKKRSVLGEDRTGRSNQARGVVVKEGFHVKVTFEWNFRDDDEDDDGHILIVGTWEHVKLHSKWDFVNVIKLRIVSWESYSGLSRWARCSHKGPYKMEASRLEFLRERLVAAMLWLWRWNRNQEVQWFLKAGKDKGTNSPLKLSEGTHPCQYLDCIPIRSISRFWPLKLTICCFKPLNLW